MEEKDRPADLEDDGEEYVLEDSTETSYDDILKEIESEDDGDDAGSGAEEDGVQLATEAPGVNLDAQRLEAERAELHDRWLRTRADFDNFRRRAEREKRDAYDHAVIQTVRSVLPVVDNLDRALDSARQHDADHSIVEGIEMIRLQLEETLRSLGVETVDPKGENFDPELHEAVAREERSDVPAHQIIDVVQKGYKLRDKLVRPAMVRVAVAGDSGSAGSEDQA